MDLNRDKRANLFIDCRRDRSEICFGVTSDSPQQAARHHVEVCGLNHGFVVVPDGCREDSCAVVVIGPDTGLRLVVVLTIGDGQWSCRVKDFRCVVQLTFGHHKAFAKTRHDRMIRLLIINRVRIMRPVAR